MALYSSLFVFVYTHIYLQSELSRLPEIENSLAIFCMATYGEGDPTDNSQDFYDWLQEGDADFTGVKYTVSSSSQQIHDFSKGISLVFGEKLLKMC